LDVCQKPEDFYYCHSDNGYYSYFGFQISREWFSLVNSNPEACFKWD
jgi:hypothetical protein